MTRVLLLAAGLGTRLRPLTNTTPKCLVPIKGQPLLSIWIERLSDAKFGPFIINTHYLANQVELFIYGSPFGNKVRLINEPTLLGTAGTLIKNLDFFMSEECLLVHADNYCLADFQAFRAAHNKRPPSCVMTMMVFRSDEPKSCGIVEIDQNGVVIDFHEKVSNPPGNLANGAIYYLSRELMIQLGRDFYDAKDFSTEILPKLLGKIYVYETSALFLDIGTLKNYQLANTL